MFKQETENFYIEVGVRSKMFRSVDVEKIEKLERAKYVGPFWTIYGGGTRQLVDIYYRLGTTKDMLFGVYINDLTGTKMKIDIKDTFFDNLKAAVLEDGFHMLTTKSEIDEYKDCPQEHIRFFFGEFIPNGPVK